MIIKYRNVDHPSATVAQGGNEKLLGGEREAKDEILWYTAKQLFRGLHCLLTCVNIVSGRRVNSSELPNQTID